MKTYTVTDLANFSGVSVRALHHYDHLGLLSPAERMEGGKRVYNRESLYQLQQILFYKEAGFSLQEIGELLLESPDDKIARLKQQKNRILDKRWRMDRLLNTIESTINELKNQNGMMNEQELYAGFSKEETAEMRKEVAERWGPDTLEESETRLKKKTPAEFKQLKEAGENIVQRMAQSMNLPIDHPEVQQLVMEYFEHQQEFRAIDKEQYSHLGQLYVEDERFTAYYEKRKEGLAKFVSEAIAYFCR